MSREEVVRVLDSQSTRSALRELHAHLMQEAFSESQTWKVRQLDDAADVDSRNINRLAEEAQQWRNGSLHPGRASVVKRRFDREYTFSALAKVVLGNLDPPCPVSVDYLCDSFATHMRVRNEEFESAYEVFVGAVDKAMTWTKMRVSAAELLAWGFFEWCANEAGVPVAEVGLSPKIEEFPDHSINWEYQRNWLSIRWAFEPNETGSTRLIAQFTGEATKDAMADIAERLGPVLRSTAIGLGHYYGFGTWAVPAQALCVDGPLLSACLDAALSPPSKGDSIDRRIRNCVLLLAEADGLKHDGIALAITMAAVEALLGKKGTELATTLGDYVAAALEPDPPHRSAASEFVKRLYDQRSRILHGEKAEGDPSARMNARILSAGLLKAMIERRDFLRKSGYSTESPDGLLRELKTGKFIEGQLTGTSQSLSRRLWRVPADEAE